MMRIILSYEKLPVYIYWGGCVSTRTSMTLMHTYLFVFFSLFFFKFSIRVILRDSTVFHS